MVEKHLDKDQSWLSRLSGKEVCVGMMWAASNNMTHILCRLMLVNGVFKHKENCHQQPQITTKTMMKNLKK